MGRYEPVCRSLASEAAQMQMGSHICPTLDLPAGAQDGSIAEVVGSKQQVTLNV